MYNFCLGSISKDCTKDEQSEISLIDTLYNIPVDHSSIKKKGILKSGLSGLRQVFATGSPLKMMKKVFYFILKALFVLRIFKFLSWLYGYVAKRLDKKD